VAGPFRLLFTKEAAGVLAGLGAEPQHATKLKRVRKALGFLQSDPQHPSLQSHKYSSLAGVKGEVVWDSYVENHTPSAWRIFWHYGPGADTITVLSISPHP
jgi:hypothetical protein